MEERHMKKWKQVIIVAALALLLGMSTKAESKAAAITGLKQTDSTKSTVYVSCDASLGVSYYILELSQDGGASWVYAGRSTSPNNISASGLAAGASYLARITGATGFSSSSQSWSACTEASAPLEVVTVPDCDAAKIAQTDAALNSVTVQASGVSGANLWIIGSDHKYESSTVLAQSASATLTVPRTTSTKTQLYLYPCRQSASGYIAHTTYDASSIYVKTLTNKLNTSNFGITSAWVNSNSFYFEIASGTVADGWQLQFQTLKGKVKKNVYTDSVSARAIVDNFVNGTFYKYRVRPYVNCATGRAFSAWSDFRYIGVPKSVSGSSNSSWRSKTKTIRCSWGKVSGASKYVVYISKSENGGYKKVKTLSAKKRSIKLTKYGKKKLKKNTRYYIKICAVGKSGKKTIKSDVNRILTSYN